MALAGDDGKKAAELLRTSIRQGAARLGMLTRQAVERLLQNPQQALQADRLFTDEERAELGKVLASTNATAELLGRARIRERLKQAERHAEHFADKFAAEQCQWITIGGKKSKEDGKRHGGSPVCIKGGKIIKGAPNLAGKKVSDLKGPSESTHRQELNREKDYQKAVFAKKARQAGHNPEDLHQLAADIQAHDQAHVEERKRLLKDARDQLKADGYDPRALTTNLRSGRVEDQIPHFDELVDSMARRYPDQFAGHESDPEARMLDILTEGNPEPMSQEDAYQQALDHLDQMKAEQAPELERQPGDEPEEDDSIGGRGGDFDFPESEPEPTADELRKQIQKQTHSLNDVESGKHPVGVEGRGGRDVEDAKRRGMFVATVNGTTLFAKDEKAAQPMMDYLRNGGRYGTPEFSRLLGYSPAEIEEYKKFLKASGQEELLHHDKPTRQDVRINAAQERWEDRAQHAKGGGLFGGEDLQAREGFRKLPNGAGVLFVDGEFQGKSGKIVRDKDPITGRERIVAEVNGRPGLVPIDPSSIEPLDAHLSWRTEHATTQAKQGGLFGANAFLKRRQDEDDEVPFSDAFTCFAEPIKPFAPLKALEYFRRLIPGLNPDPGQFSRTHEREGFNLAVSTDKTLLERIQSIIANVLETGEGDARKTPRLIDAVLDAAGVTPKNPQYAEMVVRTNLMDSYNRGSEEEMKELADDFPAWQYRGIRDGRQGKDHEPHFDKYFPSSRSFAEVRGPRVYNCRCSFQPIGKAKWKRLQAQGAKFSTFAEDAEGHEHGKDGRFVSTGQGESGGGESAAKESYQTKHEAWQQRQAARNQKVQALNSVDFSGEQHKTAAWNQVSAVDDAVRAGNGQGATEQVKAAVDKWGEHWNRAATTLKMAGASEADLAKLSRLREKAGMAVAKKADAYSVQAEKINVAGVAVREIAAVEPKEPAEPNYPDEPKPEDYADEAEYEKATDAVQAQTDKMQEEYDKAYEKWSNAHDRWEQKANRADEKLDAEKDKLEERLNDLSEALEDHHDALAEEAIEVEETVRGRLDDEEAEDEEPDDEVKAVPHSDLYAEVCKFAEVEDTERLLDVPNVRQLHNFDCILPDQEVQGRIIGASKARYAGQALEITTISGARLAITPNHPVLTVAGFVPACQLQKGQYLLHYIGEDKSTFSAPASVSRDDEQYAPAMCEEVFEALLALSGEVAAGKTHAGVLDFHGDAVCFNGDVEVVGSYRQLRRYVIPDAAHCLNQGRLVGGGARQSALQSSSHLHTLLQAVNAPTASGMGRLRLRTPCRRIHTLPHQTARFGGAANLDASLPKSTSDRSIVAADLACELLQGSPRLISLDEIVEVREFHYEGPIYDFESPLGWIIVGHLCISNCGAASTLAVSRYFGVAGKRQEEDMIRELDTTPTSIIENGTRWQNIVRWFEKAGVAAEAHRNMTLDDLRRFVAEGKPVIVALQDYGTKEEYRDNESGHYVVVCGFYQGHVVIQDPSASNAEAGGRLPDHHPDSIQDFGKLLVREQVFLDAWHDADADGTVLTRFGIAVGPARHSKFSDAGLYADLARYADDAWITIGGKEDEGKKHKGGVPVLIDKQTGEIKGGSVPKSLQGTKVGEFKGNIEKHRRGEKSEKKPPSPIDNPSPKGDNTSGGGNEPKPEEPKMGKPDGHTPKPWNGSVFHGAGRADRGGAYRYGPGAVFGGDATYYALDRGTAERYGPDVTEHKVELKDPVHIRSDEQWRELASHAGVRPDLGLKTFKPEVMAEQAEKLTHHLHQQGYDGAVITVPASSKYLYQIFGHDQAVTFHGKDGK